MLLIEQTLSFILVLLILIILTWVKVNCKYPKSRKIASNLLSFNKVRYNSFKTTILFPIILIFAYWIYLFWKGNFSFLLRISNLDVLASIFIAPIQEEIIWRGFLLNFEIMFLTHIFRIKNQKFIYKKNFNWNLFSIIIASLFLNAIVFSLFHFNGVDLRYMDGIMFGTVYLIDNKNLTPAILTHFINNLLAAFVIL
jgi:membrane protease YdiL (CAAX protease family)